MFQWQGDRIATGEVWSMIFDGGDGAPILTIDSSKLDCTRLSGIKFTYTATITIHDGDKSHTVTASAVRGAKLNVAGALREVIQMTVLDAAWKATQATKAQTPTE